MYSFTIFVITCFIPLVICESSRIFMERSRLDDQASSATGYMYHADSGGPAKYVQFTDTTGHLGAVAYPPSGYEHYTEDIPAHYEYQYIPSHESYLQYVPEAYHESHYTPYAYPYAYEYHSPGLGAYSSDKSSSFDHSGGKYFDAEKFAEHGEKDEKAFKHVKAFDKENKGKFGKEGHKGYYGIEGAKKAGGYDEADHYSAHHKGLKGTEGGSFSKENGHKKGSTTSGYHKTYHKDEFKKDHKFYDEADNRGHFDKYGDFHEEHADKRAEHEKSGKHKSGYEKDKHGKDGFYEKKDYIDKDSVFKKEKEGQAFEEGQSQFSKDAGHSSGKEFGYKEGGGKFFG